MDDEDEDEYGLHFGKADIDRVGFFDDAPPGPFDKYEGTPKLHFRANVSRAPEMRCSTVGGYFQKSFQRIFTGECLPELSLGPKKKKRKAQKVLNLGDMKIVGKPKKHSTPGDWYGCIGRQPKAFSPETIPPPERPAKVPPNVMTSPNPKGGPGYLKITMNPYLPMHKRYEPYDTKPRTKPTDSRFIFKTRIRTKPFFDENVYTPIEMPERPKKPKKKTKKDRRGRFRTTFPRAPKGKLNGCFEPFPEYEPEPYDDKEYPPMKPKRFDPDAVMYRWCPDLRSKFTTSIIELVTKTACNNTNFMEYREQVYPLH